MIPNTAIYAEKFLFRILQGNENCFVPICAVELGGNSIERIED
jgi:hypothetical protein